MTRPRPITIGGVSYPSLSAAARALNITPTQARRMALGDERVTNQDKTWKPVTFDGVTYRNRMEAARATGISYHKLRIEKRRPDPEPVTIDGVTYRSAYAASKALGIPYHKLKG